MSTPTADADLLLRAQSDPTAFEALYRRYVRRVMSYAARRCAGPEEVADLVANTFLAVLESADRYDGSRGDVFPWIIGIASHLACDQDRRARREREALARAAGRRSLDGDDLNELEDRIDAVRSRGEIELAWASLPQRHQDVLWLVGPGEMDHRQAGQALGLAAPAFRMRLMRARRALSKALAHPVPPHEIPANATPRQPEEVQPR